MRISAAVILALVFTLPSWGARPRHATLELGSVAPLVVRGAGFGAGEPVTVVAAVPGDQRIVSVTARRNGRFTVRFPLKVERCTAFTIRAIGAQGSRAILQIEPACRTKRRR